MRIAIITDIHEDLINLKEALRKIEKLKCDEIVCLGDISGYSVPHYTYLTSRNASECLSLIKSNCNTVVLGNHDLYAGRIIPKNKTAFDFPENWYDLEYYQRRKIANNSIWLHEETDLNPLYSSTDLDFLKSLPEYAINNYSGENILFSHYSYPNLSGVKMEFYSFKEEFRGHFNFMKENACNLSFTGHAHIKGFYCVTESKFKQFGYKRLSLKNEMACYGLPPLTSQQKRGGLSILDLEERNLKVVRI